MIDTLRSKFDSIIMFSENQFVTLLDRIIDTAKTKLDNGEKIVLVSEPADDVITIYNDDVTTKLIKLCNKYPDQVLVVIVSINDLKLEDKHPQIKYYHFFEFHGSYYEMYKGIDWTPQRLTKKFLSLNKRGDIWRQLLYKKFWKQGLLEDNYFSYLCERGNYDTLFDEETWEKNREFLDRWCLGYMPNLVGPWPEQKFIEIENDTQLNIYKNDEFSIDPTWKLNPEWYQNTFCSIVIETAVTKKHINFSEKTFKNIAAGQPMLLLGVKGTLQTLRDQGFDTFDDVFDNSYDDEEDLYTRIQKFFRSIDKINAMSLDDLTALKKKLKPRLEWNKKAYKMLYYRYKKLDATITDEVETIIANFLN